MGRVIFLVLLLPLCSLVPAGTALSDQTVEWQDPVGDFGFKKRSEGDSEIDLLTGQLDVKSEDIVFRVRTLESSGWFTHSQTGFQCLLGAETWNDMNRTGRVFLEWWKSPHTGTEIKSHVGWFEAGDPTMGVRNRRLAQQGLAHEFEARVENGSVFQVTIPLSELRAHALRLQSLDTMCSALERDTPLLEARSSWDWAQGPGSVFLGMPMPMDLRRWAMARSVLSEFSWENVLVVSSGLATLICFRRAIGSLGLLVRRAALRSHSIRASILGFVETQGPVSIAELARSLMTNRGTVRHHLRMLERTEKLRRTVSGREALWCLPSTPDPAAGLTRSAKRVLDCFREKRPMTLTAIASRLGFANSTVSYHVRALYSQGLLQKWRRGKYKLATSSNAQPRT